MNSVISAQPYYQMAAKAPQIAKATAGIEESAAETMASAVTGPEGEEAAAGSEALVAGKGGLNLFKWKHWTSLTDLGWREGDQFLYLPNQVLPSANWKQNYSVLRAALRLGQPIFDSYRDVATGEQFKALPRSFLNAERYILETRGWRYIKSEGAYYPPGH
jgi:hypothetical protein